MVSASCEGRWMIMQNINLNQTQSINIWKLSMDREQYKCILWRYLKAIKLGWWWWRTRSLDRSAPVPCPGVAPDCPISCRGQELQINPKHHHPDGTRINHGRAASGLLVEINEVINIRHLMPSRLLSSSSDIIIIREFATFRGGEVRHSGLINIHSY